MSDNPKPQRPKKPKITPAQVRVVGKALKPGGVKMAGSFAPSGMLEAHKQDGWDTQGMIDKCLLSGWITWGEAHGVYVATEKGREALQAYDGYLDARDQYSRDLKLWRVRQRKPRARGVPPQAQQEGAPAHG